MKQTAICLAIILFSCRSLVTTYEDVESAIYYEDASQESAEFNNTLKVMTWNIRFGAGRIPFFGDSCGDRVLMTQAETEGYLNSIVDYINSTEPDILLLQEVDISSKRSAYVNQLQYILDRTHLNYGAYASMWNAEIIASDGLGKVDAGNAVLSRWKITDAERIKLPLRTDQDALTQYFYLRRNILKAIINIPELGTTLYAVNIHATAFAKDDTKQKHIDEYVNVLNDIKENDEMFIAGGDLNALTPWASKRDFCVDDKCSGDVCDGNYKKNTVYEGSYFEFIPNEINLLRPLYNFNPAIDSVSLQQNESLFNTHSPWNTDYTIDEYWDRKLDYLFTNKQWSSIGITHNDIKLLSDHAPVSATLRFP